MNLSAMLKARAAEAKPIRVGQIGAGKFGTMFLSQVRLTAGMHLVGLADLAPQRAKDRLLEVGWPIAQLTARDVGDAITTGKTFITDDALAVIAHPEVEVVIEATGDPATGIRLCQAAIQHGKHIVMVNVEADALAGPLLARRAREAGVVYSLAWGDQPALICEHVDWARTCGFEVIAAGKGTRYHPSYHRSTPETVWEHPRPVSEDHRSQPHQPEDVQLLRRRHQVGDRDDGGRKRHGFACRSRMGLGFPPSSRFDLAEVCKPKAEGGTLEKKGVTEVVSSRRPPGQGRAAPSGDGHLCRHCQRQPLRQAMLPEYHLLPDRSGKYAALYRPDPYDRFGARGFRRLGGAAQGADGRARVFNSDVVATAKRALKQGEMLDGEGGFCVWGKQIPAAVSLRRWLPAVRPGP